MQIIIARATLKEVDGIAELFDAYRVFYQQSADKALARAFITERLEKSESVIFYAKSDQGRYLGFTQLYPTFSSVSAKRLWILNDLFVSDTARNMGLGSKLLNRAKEFAQQNQAKGISLQTAADNLGAQRLYEGLGYKPVTEYQAYFLAL
jgi:ribosomal protein S18 acetylase RimI-like enzyme